MKMSHKDMSYMVMCIKIRLKQIHKILMITPEYDEEIHEEVKSLTKTKDELNKILHNKGNNG